MVHSITGWMRDVQVKLRDPLRKRAIPERFREVCSRQGAIQIHLTLPYLSQLMSIWPSTLCLATGDHAFHVADVRTWNSPPFGLISASSLSTFRRQLKTLLFIGSYPNSFHCTWQTIFSFDTVRCPCSHFDITPPKSVLWWMNECKIK